MNAISVTIVLLVRTEKSVKAKYEDYLMKTMATE